MGYGPPVHWKGWVGKKPVDGAHEGDHGEDSGDPEADPSWCRASVQVETHLVYGVLVTGQCWVTYPRHHHYQA